MARILGLLMSKRVWTKIHKVVQLRASCHLVSRSALLRRDRVFQALVDNRALFHEITAICVGAFAVAGEGKLTVG